MRSSIKAWFPLRGNVDDFVRYFGHQFFLIISRSWVIVQTCAKFVTQTYYLKETEKESGGITIISSGS